jgi:hypothetical protein
MGEHPFRPYVDNRLERHGKMALELRSALATLTRQCTLSCRTSGQKTTPRLRKAEAATQVFPNLTTLPCLLSETIFGHQFSSPFYSDILDFAADSRRRKG